MPQQKDLPAAENGSAESVAARAERAVSDVPGAMGRLPARSVAPSSQRNMEPVAFLELMATQVLVSVMQTLQPSVASAGRAPGMPFKSHERRKLQAALAAPS